MRLIIACLLVSLCIPFTLAVDLSLDDVDYAFGEFVTLSHSCNAVAFVTVSNSYSGSVFVKQVSGGKNVTYNTFSDTYSGQYVGVIQCGDGTSATAAFCVGKNGCLDSEDETDDIVDEIQVNVTSNETSSNETNELVEVMDVSTIELANKTLLWLENLTGVYKDEVDNVTGTYDEEKEDFEEKKNDADDDDVETYYIEKLEDLEKEYEETLEELEGEIEELQDDIDDLIDDAKDEKKDAIEADDGDALDFFINVIDDLEDYLDDFEDLETEVEQLLGKKNSAASTDESSTSSTNTSAVVNATLGGACVESWTCDSWSSCSNGFQSRSCVDQNSCGTVLAKPKTNQLCKDAKDLDPFDVGQEENSLPSLSDSTDTGVVDDSFPTEFDTAPSPSVSQNTSEEGSSLWLWVIIGSIILVLVGGGGGAYVYLTRAHHSKTLPNPTLVGYIEKQRAKGRSDEDIRRMVLGAGWSEQDVDAALPLK